MTSPASAGCVPLQDSMEFACLLRPLTGDAVADLQPASALLSTL
jgi:hypothetical protein